MHVGTGTNTENNALVFNRGAKPSITGIQAAILAETSGMGSGECLTFMADQGYKFLDDVGTTEWVRIMNGNVGIGIAGPGEELSLLGKFSQKTSSGRRLVTEISQGHLYQILAVLIR